jgi:hypothetical protein
MKTYSESNVLVEVRRIKEELSEEAARISPEKFYLSLNGTAARLMATHRTTRRVVRPQRNATGKAKRGVAEPSSTLILQEKPVKYKTSCSMIMPTITPP